MESRKRVIIVGGGAAGLFAADALSPHCEVQLFEKKPAPGNKFKVAGKGGLNITNSLEAEIMKTRYTPERFLDEALRAFDTNSLRTWLNNLGIPTYVGSSGKVFPDKGISVHDVLNKMIQRLTDRGVKIHTGCYCTGFDPDHQISFQLYEGPVTFQADYIIFALGGASWPNTGSDGKWTRFFNEAGISTNPFQPSNCGFEIAWPEAVLKHHTGKPLKNISASLSGKTMKGEALITDYGLEGYAIYPLAPAYRILAAESNTRLIIDFKPGNTEAQLIAKINNLKGADYAEIFHLTSAALAIIKAYSSREDYTHPQRFVHIMKNLEIPVTRLRPMEEAISTIGGIPVEALNADFRLHQYPWIFTIGEMVDWDAPTGGFLLQGCFSMAQWVAQCIITESGSK